MKGIERMGMAPSPERMHPIRAEAERLRNDNSPGIVHKRVIADAASPQVRLIRKLLRERIFESGTRLLSTAELAADGEYHWQVCRSQMLGELNKMVEDTVGLVTQILDMTPEQLIGIERTPKNGTDNETSTTVDPR